jgi:hypothetical protein
MQVLLSAQLDAAKQEFAALRAQVLNYRALIEP